MSAVHACPVFLRAANTVVRLPAKPVDNDASARPPNLSSAYVASTFDLLTPKVDVSYPCSANYFCHWPQCRFIYFRNIVFVILVIDDRVNGQAENITCMLSPDSVA